jgi:hypothetical protein
MTVEMDPGTTHAVIVGIERYEIGWELDGAVADALRAAGWLRAAGVPAGQIVLVVDAIDGNRQSTQRAAQQLGIVPRTSATRDGILKIFTDEISEAGGDTLVVFWGGHGVLADDGDRALITADATSGDKRNIRLDDLLRYLVDQVVRRFHRQVVIVDACANFFESMKSRTVLTRATFPTSPNRRHGVEQFVLYAAAQGQSAGHKQAARSGEFSAVVLDQLYPSGGPRWPPDLPALSAHVAQHFKGLREQGRSRQTPVYLSLSADWNGDEIQREYGGQPVTGAAQRVTAETGVTASQLRRLTAALADSAMLATAERRRELSAGVALPADADPDEPSEYLQSVVTAALSRRAMTALFATLEARCSTENERLSLTEVKQLWRGQRRVAEPLRHFNQVTGRQLCAYYDVVPDRQLAPRYEELDEVLEYLAEFGDADETSPLPRFVARLEAMTGRPMADQWFGLPERALARLRAREATATRRTAGSHLVIDLRVSGSTAPGWPAQVFGYLRAHDGEWAKKPVDCPASREGAQQAVTALINWAYDQQNDPSTMTLGFLAPRARFDDIPESWTISDELARVPIGETYPVMLHSGERLQVKRAYHLWREQVRRIAAEIDLNTATVAWLDRPDNGDARAITRRVLDVEACCVGFGFVPGPLQGALPDDPLVAALSPGAPYLLWLDEEPADWDAAREVLTALVQQGDFDGVPARLLRLRRRAAGAGLGSTVRLLWDKGEWLPEPGQLPGLTSRTGAA